LAPIPRSPKLTGVLYVRDPADRPDRELPELEPGERVILVGSSSRDIRQVGRVRLAAQGVDDLRSGAYPR
jgi:hypothetical protein